MREAEPGRAGDDRQKGGPRSVRRQINQLLGETIAMTTDLKKRVHSNLDDALENGYDVSKWEIDDIVTDLICFAADCDNETPEDLKPHVESWVAMRRNVH
jgi:hypothetical protein